MLFRLLSFAILVSQTFAGPVKLLSTPPPLLAANATRATEINTFIALGDSYASGVGAGTADDPISLTLCLRYDQAYPRKLARDERLPGIPDELRLTNNACSGQTIEKILDDQLRDDNVNGFKEFGKPQFALIHASGDDVQFSQLVLSCIYETPVKPEFCESQINKTMNATQNAFIDAAIFQMINKTMLRGAKNRNDFRIYYLGYAQFFSEQTTDDTCDKNTWSRCKPWQIDCEKPKLGIDRRKKLNQLALALNKKIQIGVKRWENVTGNTGKPLVKYVDIDDLFEKHRYCEEGKKEPVKNDDDIWFFQWLDDESNDDNAKHEFYNKVAQNFSMPSIDELQKALATNKTNIHVEDFIKAEVNVARNNPALQNSINAVGAITNRVKAFHPKPIAHEKISERLRDLIMEDFGLKSK